jgi:hypothetical protein
MQWFERPANPEELALNPQWQPGHMIDYYKPVASINDAHGIMFICPKSQGKKDMSKYTETMKSNPPALCVVYTRGETRDKDQYQWGVRGGMPSLQLVGFITRVQAELAFRNPDTCDDDKEMLVIAYNPKTEKMSWFVSPKIPVDALVGNLELVKQQFVMGQLNSIMEAAKQSAQTGLLDPTGRPIVRGPGPR